MPKKKKSYTKVGMESYVVHRNEPVVQDWPRQPLPFSKDGILIGTRHFGDMCAVNPKKSTCVRVVGPDEKEIPQVMPASGCVLFSC